MQPGFSRSFRQGAEWMLSGLFLVAGAASISGCNADGPISIVTTYGTGIKFSGLGARYAWAATAPDPRVVESGLDALIRSSVEKRLAKKGFESGSTGAVDFWIDYRVARREKTYAGAVAFGETIDEGSLVLEILDPGTRQFIWRGIARARIMDGDPVDVRKQRIENALSSLMNQFPKKK